VSLLKHRAEGSDRLVRDQSRETVDDAAKKRSASGIASLAIAVLAGLCIPVFLGLPALTHDERDVVVGPLLALLIAPVGIVVGAIALLKRSIRFGLAGLLLNILFSVISLLIVLKELLTEVVKGMSAVR
jgi:hypothetical protein